MESKVAQHTDDLDLHGALCAGRALRKLSPRSGPPILYILSTTSLRTRLSLMSQQILQCPAMVPVADLPKQTCKIPLIEQIPSGFTSRITIDAAGVPIMRIALRTRTPLVRVAA